MKTSSVALVLSFLICGTSATAFTSTESETQDTPQTPLLGEWVENQFLANGRTCYKDFRARDNKTSVVPPNVRNWPVVQNQWDKNIQLYSDSSLDAIFARVFERASGNQLQQVGLPIGPTWSVNRAPIVYLANSSLRRVHNCTTILSGDAKTRVRIGFAGMQASVNASTSSTDSETTFAYGGSMISPITAAIGLNTVVDRPANISEFSVLLSLWQWLRANPSYISKAEENKLEIRNQVNGLAIYRIAGLTQSSMLRGGASFSVPFISFSGRVNGSVAENTDSRRTSYSVATWGQEQMAYFPTPSTLTTLLARLAPGHFEASAENPTSINSDAPFTFRMNLQDVPSAYCTSTFWEQVPEPITVTNGSQSGKATYSNLQVSPLLTEAGAFTRTCQFSVNVQPPEIASGILDLQFSISSKLPRAVTSEATTPVEPISTTPNQNRTLTLTTPIQKISDLRAATTVEPAKAPTIVQLIDATSTPILVEYGIRETEPTLQSSGIIPGSVQMTILCGTNDIRGLTNDFSWSRSQQGAKLSGQILIPQDALGNSTSSMCRIDGKADLLMGQQPPRSVTFPTVAINIRELEREAAIDPEANNQSEPIEG